MSDNSARIEQLLASIDRRLALLTSAEERSLKKALRDFLRTPARFTMFESIDGRRSSSELAEQASITDRAGQLFVKEMLDLGLVRVSATREGSRAVIVERDEDAIVQWHAARQNGQ